MKSFNQQSYANANYCEMKWCRTDRDRDATLMQFQQITVKSDELHAAQLTLRDTIIN